MMADLTDVEAEQAIVGSLLRDFHGCADTWQDLDFDDFSSESCRTILAAIRECAPVVDIVTLDNALAKLAPDAKDGLFELAVHCMQATPSTSGVGEYARIVHELAVRRRAVILSRELADAATDRTKDIADVLDDARVKLIGVDEGKRDRGLTQRELLELAWRDLEDRMSGRVRALPTGSESLDALMGGGLYRGELTIIAARPAQGKSAMGLFLANSAAAAGYRAMFVSEEMSESQLGARVLSSVSGVPGMKIRSAQGLTDDDVKLARGAPTLAAGNAPVRYEFACGTVEEVRRKATREKSQRGLDVLCVDYVQLMRSRRKTEQRYAELGEISRELKRLAVDLDVCVLALAQLGREADARMGGLADLRESGNLESDADNVLILYHPPRDDPWVYEPDRSLPLAMFADGGDADPSMPWYLVARLAKARQGCTGAVPLIFNRSNHEFKDINRREQ